MLDPASDPRLHAPLRAVIRFGKGGERLIPVTLGARLSEVGTLETWAESKVSEHRWRLQFQLRKERRRCRIVSRRFRRSLERCHQPRSAGRTPKP